MRRTFTAALGGETPGWRARRSLPSKHYSVLGIAMRATTVVRCAFNDRCRHLSTDKVVIVGNGASTTSSMGLKCSIRGCGRQTTTQCQL